MTYNITDNIAIVTGGASGIGELIVREFLQDGAKHVAILDIAAELGEKLSNELNSKYGAGKAKFFKCDVTNEEDLNNAFAVTIKEQGHIDTVINNAGIMNDEKSVYKKSIAVNVTALITSSFMAYDHMRKDKGGRGGTVLNVASVVGITSSPILPVYYATKSAVIQFGRCMGFEQTFKRTGVRFVTLCFGATRTPLLVNYKPYDEEGLAEMNEEMQEKMVIQEPESAVRGVIEGFKKGNSGSVWVADSDRPPVDITENVKQGYNTMATCLDDYWKLI